MSVYVIISLISGREQIYSAFPAFGMYESQEMFATKLELAFIGSNVSVDVVVVQVSISW